MNKPLNLIILGPQGSGKGTQAELLAQKFGLAHLGSGDLLREIAKTDTVFGREIHQIVNVEGRYVSDEIMSRVFREKLEQIPRDQGVILDGYPRNPEQYRQFQAFWPQLKRGDYHILFIELGEAEAVKRLSTRLVCENCGTNYIAGTAQKCGKCGGLLIQREDDKPETISQRLKLFNELALPMVAEMEKAGRFQVIRIDGAPAIEEVNQEILEKLNLS